MHVRVPGGVVLLRIDPRRLAWANEYALVLVLCIFAVTVTTGFAVGSSTAKRALEPLARTTSALDRLGDGDFQVEPVRTNDPSELGKLASAYNRAVAAVRKAFAERERAEWEMQQFVADAGHQLRTPLTVIMGHLSALSLQASDRRTEAALQNMLRESRRMRALIEDLIALTRLEESNETLDRIDLRAMVVEFASAHCADGGPAIELGELEEGFVPGRASDLHGVLAALVDNAAKYAQNSSVEIDLQRVGTILRLRVMDRGPGMSAQDLERAYDRFYRGAAAVNAPGSGLGLAIIRRVVDRVGGSVAMRNREGGGLECTLDFPASPHGRADYGDSKYDCGTSAGNAISRRSSEIVCPRDEAAM